MQQLDMLGQKCAVLEAGKDLAKFWVTSFN